MVVYQALIMPGSAARILGVCFPAHNLSLLPTKQPL